MLAELCALHTTRAGGFCNHPKMQCQGIRGGCGKCGFAKPKEEADGRILD